MRGGLSKYIEFLEREGELVRISAPVDPVLEVAELTDRVSKGDSFSPVTGGKALFFERPLLSDGSVSPFPVVTNLFGSEGRIAMALGVANPTSAGSRQPDAAPSGGLKTRDARSIPPPASGSMLDPIAARLDNILQQAFEPRGTWGEKAGVVPLLAQMSRWFPVRKRGRGECQQVVLEGGLDRLPILKCWPHDGGRFVTLPLVHTVDPATGGRNVGMYRMQVQGDRATGMHWQMHKTGARHYAAYKRMGIERMPVSVCLGGDPVYTYAATAPMPDGMDEYLLAGFLRRRPVRLVKCLTNDLYVPADCDFVIEGWVDTTEPLKTEGPFGDHTGFYSLEDDYPVFHVECVTHRRGAIWPATLVGVPPQEDAWFAEATERIFLPPIRRALQPEVRDLHMPAAGVAHNLAIVSLDVSYPGQAVKVANGLWGAGQMMFCKVIVAVPAGVDVRDYGAVLSLLRRLDPTRDLHFAQGVADVLDHATATPGVGSKLLVDLTFLDFEKIRQPAAWGDNEFACKIEFLFDDNAKELSDEVRLWLGLANLDPARDITIDNCKVTVDCRAKLPKDALRSERPSSEACEGFARERTQTYVTEQNQSCNDASGPLSPQKWPNVVAMDEATIARVDGRWAEYGIGGFIESPSVRYRKLLFSDSAEVK